MPNHPILPESYDLINSSAWIYTDDIRNPVRNPAGDNLINNWNWDNLMGTGIKIDYNPPVRHELRTAAFKRPRNHVDANDFVSGLEVSTLKESNGQELNQAARVQAVAVGGAAVGGLRKRKRAKTKCLEFCCYYLTRYGKKLNIPYDFSEFSQNALSRLIDTDEYRLRQQGLVFPVARRLAEATVRLLGLAQATPIVKILSQEYVQHHGTHFIDQIQFGASIKFVLTVAEDDQIDVGKLEAELQLARKVNIIETLVSYLKRVKARTWSYDYSVSGLQLDNLPNAQNNVEDNVEDVEIKTLFDSFLQQARRAETLGRLNLPIRCHCNSWPNYQLALYDPNPTQEPDYALLDGRINTLVAVSPTFETPEVWALGLDILRNTQIGDANRNALLNRLPMWIRNILYKIHNGQEFEISTRAWLDHKLYVQQLNFGVLSNMLNPNNSLFKLVPTLGGRYFHLVNSNYPRIPLFRTNIWPHEILCTSLGLRPDFSQQCFELYPKTIAGQYCILLSARSAPDCYVCAGTDIEGRCRAWATTAEANTTAACHFLFR